MGVGRKLSIREKEKITVKQCPICGIIFDDEMEYCEMDGAPLNYVAAGGAAPAAMPVEPQDYIAAGGAAPGAAGGQTLCYGRV